MNQASSKLIVYDTIRDISNLLVLVAVGFNFSRRSNVHIPNRCSGRAIPLNISLDYYGVHIVIFHNNAL